MRFCLVSKLKGEVNNDFLPTFGYQQLYFHTDRPIDISMEGLNVWAGTVDDAKPYYLRGSGYFLGTDDVNLGKEVIYDNTDRFLFKKIHLDGDAMFEIPNLALGQALLNKFNVIYTYIDNVDVLNFDTGIIPQLFSSPNYGYKSFTIYADYISGRLSDIFHAPINNNMGFDNIRISPKHQSPNFVGDLSEITFSNDKQAWTYTFRLYNLPNLTGNLNAFLDRLGAAIARYLQGAPETTLTTKVEVKNCPGIFYNGESTGVGFAEKSITFNEDGTWSE